MIQEIKFIRDYTSFWRTISPLSEDFVRRINVEVLNRYQHELDIYMIASSRRALINEIGFEIFYRCQMTDSDINTIITHELDEISNKISSYIAQLRNGAPKFNEKMDILEIQEATEIAKRLLSFFKNYKQITIRPKFSGCGKINSCQGDVIADNTLYEVKAGNRAFKSVDLRQLILYLTLNHNSKQYNIENLGLYNPRKGFHFKIPHQDFSIYFSGLSTEELCHRISYELTSIDFNRLDSIL